MKRMIGIFVLVVSVGMLMGCSSETEEKNKFFADTGKATKEMVDHVKKSNDEEVGAIGFKGIFNLIGDEMIKMVEEVKDINK